MNLTNLWLTVSRIPIASQVNNGTRMIVYMLGLHIVSLPFLPNLLHFVSFISLELTLQTKTYYKHFFHNPHCTVSSMLNIVSYYNAYVGSPSKLSGSYQNPYNKRSEFKALHPLRNKIWTTVILWDFQIAFCSGAAFYFIFPSRHFSE